MNRPVKETARAGQLGGVGGEIQRLATPLALRWKESGLPWPGLFLSKALVAHDDDAQSADLRVLKCL